MAQRLQGCKDEMTATSIANTSYLLYPFLSSLTFWAGLVAFILRSLW